MVYKAPTYWELSPAYGRDYKNAKEVRAEFAANKDFIEVTTRSYVNKSQMKDGDKVTIRYKGLAYICSITVRLK